MTRLGRRLVGWWIRFRVLHLGYEPSHPWASHKRGRTFDWDKERARQKREGAPWR